jgi:hypothetical protein
MLPLGTYTMAHPDSLQVTAGGVNSVYDKHANFPDSTTETLAAGHRVVTAYIGYVYKPTAAYTVEHVYTGDSSLNSSSTAQKNMGEALTAARETRVGWELASRVANPQEAGIFGTDAVFSGAMQAGGVTVTYTYSMINYAVVYAPGSQGTWTAASQTTGGLLYGATTPSFTGNTATDHTPGYTFVGWAPTVAATVTGNAEYVAQWTQDEYTVIYAPGSQGTWTAASQTTGGLLYGATTPSFTGDTATDHTPGYTFAGWLPTVAATVTESVTYTAQWSQDEYTVVYAPGAQGTWTAASQTTGGLLYGAATPSFTGDTATDHTPGYTFTGWAPTVAATVTGNAEYVAQWRQDDYTVVYAPGAQGTWLAAR